ncbi:MAG: PadR family transcriptional regulator [Candidatus Omnitrophica bacterium]|nr:PadR family transcriptional regulator [Candidatus Omnitrophota bacterium]MDD5355359.1 PadR family transcriptional regulator [Candidatus Omnitrophota bacterium]
MKIEQELIILGLLKEKARHGYEIKKQINDSLIFFTGLGYESIYYSLCYLEKQGLVKKIVTSSKSRPDKYVYSLTDKGKDRFGALLNRSFLHVQRPYFGIDISLFFLPYLKQENVKNKLKIRLKILKKIEKDLFKLYSGFKNKKPAHLLAILEHNLDLMKAEIGFVSRIITTLP